MKYFISYSLRMLAAAFLVCAIGIFTSCRQNDLGVDDDGINFSLLFDCMWVPEQRDHIPDTEEIPFVALDSKYPVYFSEDGTKLEILHHIGDDYTPYKTYNALIDETTAIIMLSAKGEQTYWAKIHRLNPGYLTVYFGSDEDNYIIYKREKMPAELSVGNAK